MADHEEDVRRFVVVVNDEEQHSTWLEGTALPAGWREVGVSGSKSECLAHIEQVWTDIRPLSLRRWLEEHSTNSPSS